MILAILVKRRDIANKDLVYRRRVQILKIIILAISVIGKLPVQGRAVVGIELQVERMQAKFKLSQNRDPAERAGVQQGLAETALGEFMAAINSRRDGN